MIRALATGCVAAAFAWNLVANPGLGAELLWLAAWLAAAAVSQLRIEGVGAPVG